ncbi:MAG: hypothetical protein ACREUY_05305, partial [Burkholderiales bacterium]
APSGGSATDPVQTLLGAANLLKDLGVGKTGETTTADIFLKLATEFAPTIAEIAKAQVQARVIPSLPQLHASVPASSAPAVSVASVQPEEPSVDMLTAGLRQFLPMLIAQAAAGNDPYKYADMILDHVPVESVSAFVARADWFGYLIGIHPGVVPHQQWFNTLRANLLELLTQEQNERSTPLSDEISSDAHE